MTTKLTLTRFVETFGPLNFDEKSFFAKLLVFTQFWVFETTKSIHCDNPGIHASGKHRKISSKDKMHLKCDISDGSLVNGPRQQIL